ncbi:MAG: DUF756 domain-containing protein, partial [Bacteroidetes bacterium]|nr:DUF756 domain-containing protein [Bacteroidota bacterium]
KFKKEPAGYKKQSSKDIEKYVQSPAAAGVEFMQEKGTRPSSALPYELYTHGRVNAGAGSFALRLEAGKQVFGDNASGTPYTVVAPGSYTDNGNSDTMRSWHFAVAAGDSLSYEWPLNAFAGQQYHLQVHGPNGFYRSFKGSAADAPLSFSMGYESKGNKSSLTGNLVLTVMNNDRAGNYEINITDLSKSSNNIVRKVAPGTTASIVLDTKAAHSWYDVLVKVKELPGFEQQYAGRVETGKESISDPMMG